MAAGFQQTMIVGNLGRDPEMRYTAQGVPVTNFSVAVNRTWTDNNGAKHEKVTWYRVSAWRRLAETCNEYLKKGRAVLVIGEMQEPRPYQGRDGEWRASLDLQARTVQFLGGGSGGQDSAQAGPGRSDQEAYEPPDIDDEELPF
jgi:single-strand DNA-binding protein